MSVYSVVFFMWLSFFVQQEAFATKELRVCSELAYLPLEMKAQDGTIFGYEIDLLKEFASQLNYKIKYFEVSWNSAISSLLVNKCDLVASGFTPSEARGKLVYFTDTTYQIMDYFVFKSASANKFHSLSDFDKKGLFLSVRQGNEMDKYLEQNFRHSRVLTFPNSDADAVDALIANKVSAVALHSPTATAVVAKNKGVLALFPSPIPTGTFLLSFATQKNPAGLKLKEEFNSFFAEFKKTKDFQKIYDYYFRNCKWIDRT